MSRFLKRQALALSPTFEMIENRNWNKTKTSFQSQVACCSAVFVCLFAWQFQRQKWTMPKFRFQYLNRCKINERIHGKVSCISLSILCYFYFLLFSLKTSFNFISFNSTYCLNCIIFFFFHSSSSNHRTFGIENRKFLLVFPSFVVVISFVFLTSNCRRKLFWFGPL